MLPTAELHVHIEGTLEPELLVRLARRNGIALPSTDPDELRAEYQFTSLQSFLDLYYRNVAVLRTEADFRELAAAYLARAAGAGVRRAEIFFDLQQHLSRGVPPEVVFGGLSSALAEGRAAHDMSADLIMCFLRDRGPEEAMQTLRAALPYRQHFIGVGLVSTEIGYPPSSSATSSPPPPPKGCTGSPTPARKPARITCGRRSTCSGPSASTMGSGPWRTRA